MKKKNFAITLDSLVPISSLNQGKAAKIISDLTNDEVKIVIKNNEPIAAILSVERLNELINAENKLNSMQKG